MKCIGRKTPQYGVQSTPQTRCPQRKATEEHLSVLKGSVHNCLLHNSDKCQVKRVGFLISSTVSSIGKSVHERRGHDWATVLFSQEVTALLCWMRKESIEKMEKKNIQQKMLDG